MRPTLLLLVLLLAPLASLVPATVAQASTPPVWWGPTPIGQGHHLRVGATVTNDGSSILANAVVAFEVDLGEALVAAGWPSSSAGGDDRISGFRLDPASIRVAAMTDLDPPAAGTSHGQLRAVATAFPASDPRRYEVPSVVYEGSFDSDQAFHPAVNPIVTVVWRIPEALAPAASRHFFVYFDSLLSSDAKQPRDFAGSAAGGDVLSLFWSGWGTTLHGYSKPVDGRASGLQVVAREAGTSVEVFSAAPGQSFRRVESFQIAQAFGSRQVAVAGTSPLLLKIVADRPVLGQMTSTGFVPSLDGGMAGRDFVFAMTHSAAWEQDTVYFGASTLGESVTPTTIEVTRLDGAGPTLRYSLASGTNPWPYTVGPRASIEQGACTRPIPDAESPALPFGPGIYRARVTSGERVLLQHQAVDALSQVPTVTGAPAGTDFLTALPWTDESGGASCNVRTRTGSLFTSSVEEDATFTVTSPDLAFQVYPRGAANPPAARFPPARIIDGDGTQQGPFDVTARDSADRMLRVTASGPVRLLTGQAPAQIGATGNLPPGGGATFAQTATPFVNGPLGGLAGGRSFTGYGPAVVVAPFDGTALQVSLRTAAGWTTRSIALSQDASYALVDPAPSTPLLDYRIDANLPVVVHPALASSGTFAGIPKFLSAQAGAGQYRGYLVDLASPDGDPVTRSTAPGSPSRFPLTLSNLARGADGSGLGDSVTLTADVPAGWELRVDGAALTSGQSKTFSMTGGQVRPVAVEVRPPPDVAVDTTGIVTLTARSAGNTRIADQIQLVTFIKSVFKVNAWFDAVNGPKDQEQQVSTDGLANYTVVLQNLGTKSELIQVRVTFKGSANGWQATLDGQTQLEFELEAGTDIFREVALKLTAPQGSDEAEATAVVTAWITQAPAARDGVQALARRSVPSDLELEAPFLTGFALPGQEAVFPLNLTAAGFTKVSLQTQGGSTRGWGAPRVVSPTRSEADLDVWDVGPSTPRHLEVRVPASATARAGNATTVRFAAVSLEDGQSAERVFFVKVLARHALQAAVASIEDSGGNFSLKISVRNGGNLDEKLRLAPGDLPTGWNATLTSELQVARGATQTVLATLRPGSSAPGAYNVSIRFVAQDGNLTVVRIPVHVDAFGRASVTPPSRLGVQPGETVVGNVPVANRGNADVVVRVVPAPGEGWTLTPPVAQTLRPNELANLPVRWIVPIDAVDGVSTHRARVEFTPVEAGDDVPPAIEVPFDLDVGRPDLVVSEVVAAPGPVGTLVRATITNAGDRTASSFMVDLAVDGSAVDRVRVGRLAANKSLEVTLVLASPGAATVHLDADGTVAELDEANNGAAVAAPSSANEASAGVLAALGGLLVAASLRRRRR